MSKLLKWMEATQDRQVFVVMAEESDRLEIEAAMKKRLSGLLAAVSEHLPRAVASVVASYQPTLEFECVGSSLTRSSRLLYFAPFICVRIPALTGPETSADLLTAAADLGKGLWFAAVPASTAPSQSWGREERFRVQLSNSDVAEWIDEAERLTAARAERVKQHRASTRAWVCVSAAAYHLKPQCAVLLADARHDDELSLELEPVTSAGSAGTLPPDVKEVSLEDAQGPMGRVPCKSCVPAAAMLRTTSGDEGKS